MAPLSANIGNQITQYDMLAAITQNTINMQFKLLWANISSNKMIWKFDYTDDDTGIDIHYSFDGIMSAPTVVLGTSTSPNFLVKLCVNIPSGKFSYGGAKLKDVSINDWKYVFDVDVNFTAISQKQIANKKDIPEVVKKMLYEFDESQFTINHLFMNFQNANIAAYDPLLSSLPLPPDTAEIVIELFQTGIANYFKGLAEGDNPYVLGFQISDKAPSSDPSFPPTFKPTSGTYCIF